MSVGSNPDGGYTVPVELEKQIGQRLTQISPIRGIAGVREISGNVYKKPFMITGPAVGWVGETDPRAQTASPTLDQLSFPAMELYAQQPAATATLH
jgi:HK97 family phage major capsid protein